MNKKGVAFILVLVIVLILLLLGGAMLSRSIAEVNLSNRYLESVQAFWLAEAGVGQALYDLRVDYNATSVSSTACGAGGYSAVIVHNLDTTRTVTASGFIPSTGTPRVQRILEVAMNQYATTPPNFYSHAIYSAGALTFDGNAYGVTGDAVYGGSLTGSVDNVVGTVTNDTSIVPLAHLNFDQLKAISQGQSNYHDAENLSGPFPASFWYDETNGIPNVVYLEGTFTLSGNNTLGGFYVVGGDVIFDAAVGGNTAISGAVYTLGDFVLEGGGNVLNVDGGIWSGGNTTITGSSDIAYNAGYMAAIQNLGVGTEVQMLSWDDTQDPIILVP